MSEKTRLVFSDITSVNWRWILKSNLNFNRHDNSNPTSETVIFWYSDGRRGEQILQIHSDLGNATLKWMFPRMKQTGVLLNRDLMRAQLREFSKCYPIFLFFSSVCVFEPTCAHARWALRSRFLSVRLSVCLSGFTQATLYTTTTVYGVLVHQEGAICTTKAQLQVFSS